MTISSADLLARLERCEMELQANRGYMKALEAGLQVVIATTKDPAALAELWQHVLAEAPEQAAPGATELYHAAFRTGLAKLSTLIEGTVERSQEP